MTAEQAVQYYHALERFGMRPGLERMAALCARLGNPQETLRCIHVAGTNGKGTCCHLVAETLQRAGYRVGLYTSPYVLDFRERIQLNGQMIPMQALGEVTDTVKAAADALLAEDVVITAFEAITAAAFLYFSRVACDFVVLEVGMGGRFDATNVIPTPILSVITAIALDHTQVLGNTLSEIAYEKCGILKPGGQAVLYPDLPPEALRVIREQADARQVTLIVPDQADLLIQMETPEGSRLRIENQSFFLHVPGRFMAYNAMTAFYVIQTLRRQGFCIPENVFGHAASAYSMPGRMEYHGTLNPRVLIDGSHNPQGAAALVAVLQQHFSHTSIVSVCACMADKDVTQVLRLLAPQLTHLFATTLPLVRAMPAERLAESAESAGIPCTVCADAADALRQARQFAEPDALVLIHGSLYLVSALREQIDEGAG